MFSDAVERRIAPHPEAIGRLAVSVHRVHGYFNDRRKSASGELSRKFIFERQVALNCAGGLCALLYG